MSADKSEIESICTNKQIYKSENKMRELKHKQTKQ